MNVKSRRAAIDLRVSQDRENTRLGVDRHREDAGALIKARGWTPAGSDFSRKAQRPDRAQWSLALDDRETSRTAIPPRLRTVQAIWSCHGVRSDIMPTSLRPVDNQTMLHCSLSCYRSAT